MTVEAFGEFPSKHPIVVIVKHYQFPLRDTAQEGFHILRGPVIAVVDEEPSHLQPHRIGVRSAEGFTERLAHTCKRFRIPRRGIHFVEGIQSPYVVRSEESFGFFHAGFLDFGIKGIGRRKEPAAIWVAEISPVAHFTYLSLRMHILENGGNTSAECVQYRLHR